MEKLEAALARAREMRRAALGDAGIERTSGTSTPSAPAVEWAALPEISVSDPLARRNRIAAAIGGREASPFDMLRSRTLRQIKEKNWTRIALTSPGPACGKTTVAINLALSLSRQRDLRVMLLDFDLRRPSLHRTLDATPRKSLHEFLEGKAEFAETAYRIEDNLVVSMNATPHQQPAELMQSESTRQALDLLERAWRPDVMLFDMSPMLASDDNVGFLSNADCALLVVAAESTTLPNIDACEKELAQLTNVLGVVLNKCRYEDEGAGYAYGTYG